MGHRVAQGVAVPRTECADRAQHAGMRNHEWEVLGTSNGMADVEIAGARLRLRAPGNTRPGAATACLRPDACAVRQTGDGLPARVLSIRFTGPSQLVRLAVEDGSGSETDATAARATALAEGDPVRVVIRDGWTLPSTT